MNIINLEKLPEHSHFNRYEGIQGENYGETNETFFSIMRQNLSYIGQY